jgi:hypothetical protein
MTAETKLTEETKLFEEKKVVGPFIARFIESISKTNTEKITEEILEGLSEDTDDSDSYDAESGDEDSEDRPWRPSHSVFGRLIIKQSHLDNTRGRYFRDMSIVRVGGDIIIPAPEGNEVVIYRSFFKAGLRFPLSKFVVEDIPDFPSSDHPRSCDEDGDFCLGSKKSRAGAEREVLLQYETKATGKEQYHNNFGCYGFIARPNASHPVPTFRKRWPGSWMGEWFYVKNDLKAREDIKEIIQRPIWSHFGLHRWKLIAMSKHVRELLALCVPSLAQGI